MAGVIGGGDVVGVDDVVVVVVVTSKLKSTLIKYFIMPRLKINTLLTIAK